MSFLSKVFGGGKDHPPLDPNSVAARHIEQRSAQLAALAAKVKDRIEVVPAEDATYVFIGKPPGAFGIAWLQDGEEYNLRSVIQERKLSPATVQRISERLRDAYEAHMRAERFQTSIGGKPVKVTPSPALAEDVRKVIDAIAAA